MGSLSQVENVELGLRWHLNIAGILCVCHVIVEGSSLHCVGIFDAQELVLQKSLIHAIVLVATVARSVRQCSVRKAVLVLKLVILAYSRILFMCQV